MIRIAAVTLVSDSAITIARFRPSKIDPLRGYYRGSKGSRKIAEALRDLDARGPVLIPLPLLKTSAPKDRNRKSLAIWHPGLTLQPPCLLHFLLHFSFFSSFLVLWVFSLFFPRTDCDSAKRKTLDFLFGGFSFI